jgi:hypothetical protein
MEQLEFLLSGPLKSRKSARIRLLPMDLVID